MIIWTQKCLWIKKKNYQGGGKCLQSSHFYGSPLKIYLINDEFNQSSKVCGQFNPKTIRNQRFDAKSSWLDEEVLCVKTSRGPQWARWCSLTWNAIWIHPESFSSFLQPFKIQSVKSANAAADEVRFLFFCPAATAHPSVSGLSYSFISSSPLIGSAFGPGAQSFHHTLQINLILGIWRIAFSLGRTGGTQQGFNFKIQHWTWWDIFN